MSGQKLAIIGFPALALVLLIAGFIANPAAEDEPEQAEQPFNKLKPIVALVNGREYTDEAAEEFADRLECDVMLCGHTPTSHGFTVKNKRHLIVDSQHPKARYVAFDKQQRYETSEALAEELNTLYPDSAEREIEGELL